MASDREYAHYLERDWLVWECDNCGYPLDDDGYCEICTGEDDE